MKHYGQHPVCDLCDSHADSNSQSNLARRIERSRRADIARKRATEQRYSQSQIDRIASYAADLTRPWFEPGDRVECLDAMNGCHFLEVGKVFTVQSIQFDAEGQMRLNLVGMARAWEIERFTAPDPFTN